MQKFNLGEIIKFVDGKPCEIIGMCEGAAFFDISPNKLVEWSSSSKFSTEMLIAAPVYTVKYPRPLRTFSFQDFLDRYGAKESYELKLIYEQYVPSYTRANVSELFVEFVADSMEDWLNSFESKDDAEDFLATYSNPIVE